MSARIAKGGFNLSAWALANQQLVAFFMLVIAALGAYSYQQMPRNEDPAFTIKTAVVSAAWPGASVEDTTSFVTDRLEKKLQETPYLDYLQSYTRAGESVIFVHLRDDTPPQKVADLWYQVRKKMSDVQAQLPLGTRAISVNDEFDDTYGTIYGFISEGFTARELRDYVDVVRDELLRTPNVGKIEVLGVEEEQVVIEFSPQQLAGLGLDTQQVIDSLRAQNAVTPAGTIRTEREKLMLRVDGAFASEASIAQITLNINNRFVALSDIASIRRQLAEPPASQFRVNGEKAIGLAVSMAPTGNMLEFGAALREVIAHATAQLPHGIEMVEVADQSHVVKDAVNGFIKVLIEAIAIVLAVSFVSLGTRAGLVVAASIPLVLAMTFVGMEIAGIGLQRISLGALIISLGLLVDDAMITVEAMVSRLENGWERSKAAAWAYETTAFPMLTGTLVMIAGFIPVGFASSSAGEYCFSLFMVVLIALVSSWIVAILFSPLLGVWLLSNKLQKHEHKVGRIGSWYHSVLQRAMANSTNTLVIAVIVLALSLVGATQLKSEFFPASDRPELLVSVTLPHNSSQAATEKHVQKIENVLKKDPDVVQFSAYVGSGAIRFYLPMDVLLNHENVAQLVVVAKGLQERDQLQLRLNEYLAAEHEEVVTRVSPLELGPPVGWPIRYRISGPDINEVRNKSLELANIIGTNPSARDINLSAGEPERAIKIHINQTEARAMGLSSEDVASAMASIFSGSTISTLRDDNRLVDIVVKGLPEARRDPETLANLQLTLPNGQTVPLRQIAELSYGLEEPIIWRRQREPFISVQLDTEPGMLPQTLSAALAPQVREFTARLPSGYRLEESGAVAESAKGNASIFNVLPVTLLVMLLLLMIQLKRFSRMLIAFLTAPFGMIGVVLAMLPTGTPMGFVAILGVIALSGMIIRNAVILISEVDANRSLGKSVDESIIEATRHRSRPIVLTACAAILGMIPIAGQVFWGPMAYAIIGGLLVATALTLIVLPAALAILMRWENRHALAQQ